MSANVVKIENVNEKLQRYFFENDSVVDIPSMFSHLFNVGDNVNLQILKKKKAADIIFNGIVYMSQDNFCFISSGGMISKLKNTSTPFSPGDSVMIHLSKSRRRKRT